MGTEDIEKHMAQYDEDKYVQVSNERDELEKKYKQKCDEKDKLDKEKERLDNIVQNYLDFVRKLKEIKEQSSYEELRAKYERKPVIALSSLRSPSKTNTQLSQDQMDVMLKRTADLLLKYGSQYV
jgi:hypothetical protein